jgi:hypothetical protein
MFIVALIKLIVLKWKYHNENTQKKWFECDLREECW